MLTFLTCIQQINSHFTSTFQKHFLFFKFAGFKISVRVKHVSHLHRVISYLLFFYLPEKMMFTLPLAQYVAF